MTLRELRRIDEEESAPLLSERDELLLLDLRDLYDDADDQQIADMLLIYSGRSKRH